MCLNLRRGTELQRQRTSLYLMIVTSVDEGHSFPGIEANNDVTVTEEDWKGPLPSVLTKGVDWLLVFSVLFLASFIMYATIRTESIRWLIPGQEHEHQEWLRVLKQGHHFLCVKQVLCGVEVLNNELLNLLVVIYNVGRKSALFTNYCVFIKWTEVNRVVSELIWTKMN